MVLQWVRVVHITLSNILDYSFINDNVYGCVLARIWQYDIQFTVSFSWFECFWFNFVLILIKYCIIFIWLFSLLFCMFVSCFCINEEWDHSVLPNLIDSRGLYLLKTWTFITLSIIFFFFAVPDCSVSGASMSVHLTSFPLIFQVN